MLDSISLEFSFHFMLIVARLGTAFANFPGIDSRFILSRGKIAIILTISFILYPNLEQYLPSYSNENAKNLMYLAIEIFIGLIISIAAKIYFNAIHFVGQIVSVQSGLAIANFYDPEQRSQVSLFSNFMLLTATVYIFASDIHYYYIQSVIDSYSKFPVGELIDSGDISNFVSHIVNDSFILAFKISSPFLVVSLAILTGSGFLSRIMPNLQIFFVISPAQIIIVIATMYVVVMPIVAKIGNVISSNVVGF